MPHEIFAADYDELPATVIDAGFAKDGRVEWCRTESFSRAELVSEHLRCAEMHAFAA